MRSHEGRGVSDPWLWEHTLPVLEHDVALAGMRRHSCLVHRLLAVELVCNRQMQVLNLQTPVTRM